MWSEKAEIEPVNYSSIVKKARVMSMVRIYDTSESYYVLW